MPSDQAAETSRLHAVVRLAGRYSLGYSGQAGHSECGCHTFLLGPLLAIAVASRDLTGRLP